MQLLMTWFWIDDSTHTPLGTENMYIPTRSLQQDLQLPKLAGHRDSIARIAEKEH